MAKNEKIRIRLKSYDHKLLDFSAGKIVETAKKAGSQVCDLCLYQQKNKL